ncbi:hypothetical protein CEXT_129601 [Caerostris extrusa]|uniref:Uncharacterized protein n=1 Tax=Caerostris extrusa TaxID=172846 RepID=A0AAV4N2J0_CAEEX|nr:hypothetical protein CEXT_129601 [Caerostris extrusa]
MRCTSIRSIAQRWDDYRNLAKKSQIRCRTQTAHRFIPFRNVASARNCDMSSSFISGSVVEEGIFSTQTHKTFLERRTPFRKIRTTT